jgi:hypothetical protein
MEKDICEKCHQEVHGVNHEESCDAFTDKPSNEPVCPKCGTRVEWVIPPIPGAKPFFQCEDGDCNWMGGG